MIHRKTHLLLLLLIASLLISSCSSITAQAQNEDISQRKVRITSTIGMIGDVAKNIGGERVTVESLMGPGVDPHLYKASEGDLHVLEKSDVIFYNGLHLEAGMSRVFERMSEWKTVVVVSEYIDRSRLNSPPEFQGNYDPHIWFDVTLWKQVAEKIRDTLIEVDPGSAEIYRSNAEAYLAQLDELNSYVRQQAERVPEDKRVLITAHDAFNYFGQAYGFQVRGLQGISTATEAGTGDVQELSKFIAERQIPAIFVESSIPRRNVEAVQAAVRARGFDVRIGGELFSDAMGAPDTPEGTYIGMVRHNIDTIVGALIQ